MHFIWRKSIVTRGRKIFSFIILISITFTFTGCAKYEKDESYDTDLYGSYSHEMNAYIGDDVNQATEDPDNQYYSYEMYQFNSDNTYHHEVKEIISNETTKDSNKDGKILSVEEISDDITKITSDQKIVDWSTQESSDEILYKYKNMLGDFTEIEVPQGKTFELQINDARYDKEGQYHLLCEGSDNCDCSNFYPKYIRKDNIIYFQSMDEEHKNYYTINLYIVDNGLFCPTFYKTE